MKIQCLIIDDEPLALEVLSAYIEKVDGLILTGKCNNPVQAFEILQTEKIDLIFLDIQMPRLTGIEFVHSITKPPKIIFTTAYRDYASEAFDLDAVDYLLKPFSFARFLRAIGKAYQQFNHLNSNISTDEETISTGEPESIYVKADKKMVKIVLKDIFYIESLKDYVLIYIPGKRIITKQKISYLEEKLPEGQFLRIHRSFLVSLSKIDAFTLNHVEINGKELPIGRSFKPEVTEILSAIE